MARIPTEVARASLGSLRDPGVRVPKTDVLGEGLQDVGRFMEEWGAQLHDGEVKIAKERANANLRKDYYDFLSQAEKDQDPDTLKARWDKFSKEKMDQYARTIGDNGAREAMKSQWLENSAAWGYRIEGIANQKRTDRGRAVMLDTTDTYIDQAIMAPTDGDRMVSLNGAYNAIDDAAVAGFIDQQERIKARTRVNDRLTSGLAERYLQEDPARLLNIENDGMFTTMAPEKRLQYKRAAQDTIAKEELVRVRQIEDAADKAITMLDAGYDAPNMGDLRSALQSADASTPEAETRLKSVAQELAIAEQAKNYAGGFAKLRPVQQDAILRDLRGKVKTPEDVKLVDRLQKIASATETALKNDPLDHAARVGVVSLDRLDPENPDSIAARADAARVASVAFGVPVGLLTKDEAVSLAQTVGKAPTDERPGMLLTLQSQFGQYYPGVLRDLVDRGGLDERIGILGSVADQPGVAQTLAGVLDVPVSDLKKGLESTAVKDLRTGVASTLAPFISAVEHGDPTGGRAGQTGTIADTVEALALHYLRQTGDVDKAVKRATDEIINDRFAVEGSLWSQKQINGTRINLPVALNGLQSMQTRERLKAFGAVPFGSGEGRPDFLNEEAFLSAAENSGEWVSNETGTGAFLAIPLNGVLVAVENDQGKKFEFPFVDAMSYAVAPPKLYGPNAGLQ